MILMAIRNAAAEWGTRDLSGATMYTSFEPCPMCCGDILPSGIRVAGDRCVVELRREVLTADALAL